MLLILNFAQAVATTDRVTGQQQRRAEIHAILDRQLGFHPRTTGGKYERAVEIQGLVDATNPQEADAARVANRIGVVSRLRCQFERLSQLAAFRDGDNSLQFGRRVGIRIRLGSILVWLRLQFLIHVRLPLEIRGD